MDNFFFEQEERSAAGGKPPPPIVSPDEDMRTLLESLCAGTHELHDEDALIQMATEADDRYADGAYADGASSNWDETTERGMYPGTLPGGGAGSPNYATQLERYPANGVRSDEYTIGVELDEGVADIHKASPEWDPVTICVVNAWPIRDVDDAQFVLEKAGYPLDANHPHGILKVVHLRDPVANRTKGILFVKAKNHPNALYMLEHLAKVTVTAPRLDRNGQLSPGQRVAYRLKTGPANRGSPRSKHRRPGIEVSRAPGFRG